MPTKQLKTWAKEAGITLADAEECWSKAKKQAAHAFPKAEEDSKYWSFVNIKTRECIKEKAKNKPK